MMLRRLMSNVCHVMYNSTRGKRMQSFNDLPLERTMS